MPAGHMCIHTCTCTVHIFYLEGELGGAHHLDDVEGCPSDVIAQHLELSDGKIRNILHGSYSRGEPLLQVMS